MDSTARRSGGGLLEGLYRVIMRRTSVYATFVILGAFAGERAVDYGVHKLWERNNVGVLQPTLLFCFLNVDQHLFLCTCQYIVLLGLLISFSCLLS
ncbi:cytochrome b-c1 complex subunit 9 [Vitis vinifera]|uniref:cytochrome b-c1 complex subunit 9 n=1 Tax=Vitis vinifera TaxID=29760 RepID=UPI002883182D|nr:cytochrome b-c1 complex subunit 9 [Vitis vinifera]